MSERSTFSATTQLDMCVDRTVVQSESNYDGAIGAGVLRPIHQEADEYHEHDGGTDVHSFSDTSTDSPDYHKVRSDFVNMPPMQRHPAP